MLIFRHTFRLILCLRSQNCGGQYVVILTTSSPPQGEEQTARNIFSFSCSA